MKGKGNWRMKRATFSWLVIGAACCIMFTGQLCIAQSESERPKQLLFRGRPLPVCKSFIIWEAGILGRVNSPASFSRYPEGRLAGVLDVGVMWNRSPVQAIGGVLHLNLDEAGTRMAGLLRYRRWLNESPSGSGKRPWRVDIDAGLVIHTFYDRIKNQESFNISSGVSLNLEDLVAFTVRYETYRTKQYTYFDYSGSVGLEKTMPSQTNGTLFMGVKGGSYAGAATTLVGGGLLVLAIIFLSNLD